MADMSIDEKEKGRGKRKEDNREEERQKRRRCLLLNEKRMFLRGFSFNNQSSSSKQNKPSPDRHRTRGTEDDERGEHRSTFRHL